MPDGVSKVGIWKDGERIRWVENENEDGENNNNNKEKDAGGADKNEG